MTDIPREVLAPPNKNLPMPVHSARGVFRMSTDAARTISGFAKGGDVTKARNWTAVAAWFRRGGPMQHKTTPRGGSGPDSEIEDGLEEYQTEEARRATDKLFKATPEELGRVANQSRDLIDQGMEELQEEEGTGLVSQPPTKGEPET